MLIKNILGEGARPKEQEIDDPIIRELSKYVHRENILRAMKTKNGVISFKLPSTFLLSVAQRLITPEGSFKFRFGTVSKIHLSFMPGGLGAGKAPLRDMSWMPRRVTGGDPWGMVIEAPDGVMARDDLQGYPPVFVNCGLDISVNYNVKTLIGVHKIFKRITKIAPPATVTSGGLGVLLIPGFEPFQPGGSVLKPFNPARDIINRHLRSNRDVLACQEELIDNDLEEFAQL